jgi:hypothetical protein
MTDQEQIDLIFCYPDKLKEFCEVKDGDKHIYYLNPRLIVKQRLNFSSVDAIKKLHILKHKTFDIMINTDSKKLLKTCADTITEIEFKLQDAWGFSRDAKFHYWFEVPKCECPKMDNRERYGTDYMITSSSCPIHGE